MYELAPGQSSPYHWQMGEEECCVVIAGRPTLRTPEGERALQPWDVAYFVRGPAGTHGLRNDTDEPARVVFFSTVSDPEVAVYPDEDRVGVIAGFTNPDVETLRGRVDVR
ncbi:MAG TPA: cupin domain-containing protein [Gaiellaceae bacterium]|nr:cupin domain-containing protein [Gaiellaceae bacterium]